MLKADKERLVADLADRLKNTQTLIVADYRGLSVTDIDKLRTELLEHGARFQVVKNTLTRRAAQEAGADALLALLDGPTAIAFLESEGDPVAVAKALNNAARETKVLTIRGGILDGTEIGEAEVMSLATLPPAEVLQAQVVSAVAGPLIAVVGLFAAPLRDLVNVLDARIKQLEEQGETVPEPEPEPEPKAEAEPEPQAAAEEAPAEPEAEPEPEPEPQAAAEEAPAEPEVEPEPQAAAEEAPAEPEAEPEPEPQAAAEEAPAEEVTPEAPAAEAPEPQEEPETTEEAQEES
jgi:large subunit ribosomal protein L10